LFHQGLVVRFTRAHQRQRGLQAGHGLLGDAQFGLAALGFGV
jgi:hypothetical protein